MTTAIKQTQAAMVTESVVHKLYLPVGEGRPVFSSYAAPQLWPKETTSLDLAGLLSVVSNRPKPQFYQQVDLTTAFCIVDFRLKGSPIVFVSTSFEDLTGYSEKDCLGRNCRFLQGPDTDMSTVKRIRECCKNGHEGRFRVVNYRKNGEKFTNFLSLIPIHSSGGGDPLYSLGIQSETQWKMCTKDGELKAVDYDEFYPMRDGTPMSPSTISGFTGCVGDNDADDDKDEQIVLFKPRANIDDGDDEDNGDDASGSEDGTAAKYTQYIQAQQQQQQPRRRRLQRRHMDLDEDPEYHQSVSGDDADWQKHSSNGKRKRRRSSPDHGSNGSGQQQAYPTPIINTGSGSVRNDVVLSMASRSGSVGSLPSHHISARSKSQSPSISSSHGDAHSRVRKQTLLHSRPDDDADELDGFLKRLTNVAPCRRVLNSCKDSNMSTAETVISILHYFEGYVNGLRSVDTSRRPDCEP